MGLLRRWVGYFIADQGIRDVVQVYEESTARHGYFTAEKLGLFSAYYPPSLILRGGCRPPVERSCSFSGCLLLVCCRLGYVFGDKIQVLHKYPDLQPAPCKPFSTGISWSLRSPKCLCHPSIHPIHPNVQPQHPSVRKCSVVCPLTMELVVQTSIEPERRYANQSS